MGEAAGRSLLLPDNVVFTCQNSGACCRSDWLIGVDAVSHARLRDVAWPTLDPALGPGEKFVPLAFPLPSGERLTFARRPGRQLRLSHRRTRGAPSTGIWAPPPSPQVCREFPYHFVETPDGVAVGVSFACTAVRAHRGATLPAQRDEIEAVLAGSTRVEHLPEPLTLFGSVDIAWRDYRPIEAALLELLASQTGAAPRRAAGRQRAAEPLRGDDAARGAGAARGRGPARRRWPPALAELRPTATARLLEIARQRAIPAPSVADVSGAALHLAAVLATAALSRAAPAHHALRNYFRFRRARGPLADAITGGEPFYLEAALAVRFDATAPGVDEFLREYWSHVIFRKTLTPMHGVFRGYQTLLALYSFMKLAARLYASRAGRPVAAWKTSRRRTPGRACLRAPRPLYRPVRPHPHGHRAGRPALPAALVRPHRRPRPLIGPGPAGPRASTARSTCHFLDLARTEPLGSVVRLPVLGESAERPTALAAGRVSRDREPDAWPSSTPSSS